MVCAPKCPCQTGNRLARKPSLSRGFSRAMRCGAGQSLGPCLSQRNAGFQPGSDPHLPLAPVGEKPVALTVQLRSHHHGHPHFERKARDHSAELWRRDTDDGQLVAVHADNLSDHAGIRGEQVLPQMVADHRDRVSAGLIAILFRQEKAAAHWFYPKYVEVVAGYEFSPDSPRVLVCADIKSIEEGGTQAGDQLQTVAVVAVVAI